MGNRVKALAVMCTAHNRNPCAPGLSHDGTRVKSDFMCIASFQQQLTVGDTCFACKSCVKIQLHNLWLHVWMMNAPTFRIEASSSVQFDTDTKQRKINNKRNNNKIINQKLIN